MKPLKIAVLFGGTSQERDVSIASGTQVIKALRELGHTVISVDTARGPLDAAAEDKLFATSVGDIPPDNAALAALGHDLHQAISSPLLSDIDVCFLALHGGTGEDGTIQAILSAAGFAFTGSLQLPSGLALDKDLSKRLFTVAGIPTPSWTMVPPNIQDLKLPSAFPIVIKPNFQGSTVGLSVVRNEQELFAAVELARQYGAEILLEEYIPGRELSVGVLDNQALSVGEIFLESDIIFDYETKYSGAAKEKFPADIPAAIEQEAKRLAVAVHQALKLKGYSRSDFRLDKDGQLWCLEVNTLPGMTKTSLFPQSAAAAGIDFSSLCEKICLLALEQQ
ncbi:D-alanine--D-alanine ligase family protein [Chitinophaga nivalis]|uniref:D-alanine--D-alanine ligase n=1 Tax=Chitinophaga nivalis TaxID=2991709 RepID=A0ABT3IKA4_9BACT|nr:D-alanine--D-alanine ligase [Chitinophaga nivalis]MCW3465917.1 D-alanine--D-alanine ligase [Chitinophaga nivalis]MCW3484392.1 D-alanine--D-alanine ligase [Chitinophaga nivalis]